MGFFSDMLGMDGQDNPESLPAAKTRAQIL
jgi:hypothetical protein